MWHYKQHGIVLVILLIFLQLLTLMGLYSLSASTLVRKISAENLEGIVCHIDK